MASYLLDYEYLSSKDLAGFDRYKYKSIDNSPLSNYVMHPFWNRLVKIFPLWVPANVLTLSGWFMSLLIFLVVSYYDPHFVSSSNPSARSVPNWVWLLGAICIFCAHQLDGCDGKQARRTNSSSPLGELFDHGLDSSAVWLMGIGIFSIYGIGDQTAKQHEIPFLVLVFLYAFYVAHWEKYTTSVMFLPWAYDVSQIWLTGSYLLTYFYGPDIWKSQVYGDYSIAFFLKTTLYVLVVVVCIPVSLHNQITARKENPNDCKGIVEGLMPLVSLGSVTCLHLAYAYFSHDDVIHTQLRLYLVAFGFLYANINCRLIVTTMADGKCERFNILAYPLIPMIIATKLRLVSDFILIASYVAFLSLGHLHYGVAVVRQLCKHLNVYCFKVGKPPVEITKELHTNGYANGHTSNGTQTNGSVGNGKLAQD